MLTEPRDLGRLTVPVRLVVAVGLVGIVGCGPSQQTIPRVDIRGEVSYAGDPVMSGEVLFEDLHSKLPRTAARVVDDRYTAAVPPGHWRVAIRGYRPAGESYNAISGENEPQSEQYVPARFNSQSKLEIVVDGGRDTFDFALGR